MHQTGHADKFMSGLPDGTVQLCSNYVRPTCSQCSVAHVAIGVCILTLEIQLKWYGMDSM